MRLTRACALARVAAPQATTLVNRSQIPEPTPAKSLLELVDLQTQFHVGPRIYRAVGGVSLAIKPGECLGLIGESGSGKSVTALSITGLVASPPGIITGGAVMFDGQDLLSLPYRDQRRLRGKRIAYIFQDPLSTLHPLYRIGDQMVEAMTVHNTCPKPPHEPAVSSC